MHQSFVVSVPGIAGTHTHTHTHTHTYTHTHYGGKLNPRHIHGTVGTRQRLNHGTRVPLCPRYPRSSDVFCMACSIKCTGQWDSSLIYQWCNAPVICSSGPVRRGIAGTLIFQFAKSCRTPCTAGQIYEKNSLLRGHISFQLNGSGAAGAYY